MCLENIIRLIIHFFMPTPAKLKKTFIMDPIQEMLLKEKCLLVNKNDKVIGQATKRDCHLVQENGDIKLHRAFSVFLFNSKNELLIQRRSPNKITYPNRYSNSCCSHPLSELLQEHEEKEALGIKRAAQRRLSMELGTTPDMLPLEEFQYITRIYYKDQGDGRFGEHEIDYILFIQRDVFLEPNSNEVCEVKYLKREEFPEFIRTNKALLTPWFELISRKYLPVWWDNLDNLDKVKNHQTILHLKF